MRKFVTNDKGFGFIEYMVIFVVVFPIIMLMPDMVVWGGTWVKANGVINETAQFIGEHGGADSTTIAYLQQRFSESGLDPARWDLTISSGQVMKGDPLSIAVESSYSFNSLKMLGVEFQMPLRASATVPSQVWIR
ncbi:Pilus assembly protein [Brevibacillus sp. IT-7CA2]|uniref:hypothetical protein n=1 Tax=Brevibacillus sp. IT-7CA2 TaxID=3026436 RepID=UPI0039E023B4